MKDQPTSSPRPWRKLGSRALESLRLFRPRWDEMENPRTGQALERLVLETPEWVNVVPITEDGRIVCVRQFRFGTGTVTTEIPGGMVDPGEEPRAAAERELREETGYTATSWTSLGAVEPNPAFQDNRCHHFLARGAVRTHELELDEGEDIVVLTLSPDEIREEILSGRIQHALVVTALSRIMDLRLPGV